MAVRLGAMREWGSLMLHQNPREVLDFVECLVKRRRRGADDVRFAEIAFHRSLNAPVINSNGINNASTRAPTPSNLIIVLFRRVNDGCDFGNGGGAWVSGMSRD